MIDAARSRGFSLHSGGEDQTTTRPSRITRNPPQAFKLDWIMTRGLTFGPSRIVPAVDTDGTVLSDHDLVVLEVTGLA